MKREFLDYNGSFSSFHGTALSQTDSRCAQFFILGNCCGVEFFCSTALTSTGWVRMTTFSLGTVHHLSRAAVIESLLIFPRIIPLKKSWVAENRTRAAGARSLNATAVLWRLFTDIFM